MQTPPLPRNGSAFFFDFDGTLADLAPRPDAVVVEPLVTRLLQGLADRHAGAVAIVSGRPVAEIDQLISPLHLPVAGVHGAERRGSDGFLRRLPLPSLAPLQAPLSEFVARHPGLQLEHKPGAMALHYRAAPALEDECLEVMTRLQGLVSGLALLRGKCVVELKPRGASKGQALRRFLDERPFRHRQPWVFGDDVTDESAFDVVLGLGGVAVKVGAGETLAPYRLENPAHLHQWLQQATEA